MQNDKSGQHKQMYEGDSPTGEDRRDSSEHRKKESERARGTHFLMVQKKKQLRTPKKQASEENSHPGEWRAQGE
jgi:hypothetical protein